MNAEAAADGAPSYFGCSDARAGGIEGDAAGGAARPRNTAGRHAVIGDYHDSTVWHSLQEVAASADVSGAGSAPNEFPCSGTCRLPVHTHAVVGPSGVRANDVHNIRHN